MISTNWLRDYLDLTGIDLTLLADQITKAGVNVERVESHHIPNLVIGKVIERVDHPDSDHLNICQVDVGDRVVQIVCGASNVEEGIHVIVSLPGAVLPGNFEIKASKIRGVESNGMICALSELGLEENTEENHKKGIHILPSSAPIGEDPLAYMGLDDTIYHLDLNPNRNIDCTNHIGFAYEVASILGRKVTLPDTNTTPIAQSVEDYLQVEVETPDCSLYQAKMVRNVKIGESPSFIQNRLRAAGMRPINNVVDISNYVMLEYGQPLHFFDQEKLGDKILVRMAKTGEETVTLDGKKRILTPSDIVITDGDKPVCIAGVMGSENTDVDQNTKNIIIEAAIFDPLKIRYTSLRLDLRSEASLRYERGLNPEYTYMAIKRACYLLEKYANGEVLSDTVVVDHITDTEHKAVVSKKDILKFLGLYIDDEGIRKILDNLGFSYEFRDGEFLVTIPKRRRDIEAHTQDLVEEIGRLYGYDHIEGVLPREPIREGKYVGSVGYRKLVSKRLRALGLDEVRNYTLVGDLEDGMFTYGKQETISLLRPMSTDKKHIRQTLLPSLLKNIEYNQAHGVKDIGIYEISNVYYNRDCEEVKMALAMVGNYLQSGWNGSDFKIDFYLLKGIVENILDYLGLKNRYQFQQEEICDLHPGVSASILLDREVVGFLGKVHPLLTKKEEVYVCELSLTKLIEKKTKPIKFKEISKYPSIQKDVAFILDREIPSAQVASLIKKAGGKLLSLIDVFDVYEGDQVPENKKSIAYSLKFEDSTRTLREEEVMVVFNKIITEVEQKLNAQLRDK